LATKVKRGSDVAFSGKRHEWISSIKTMGEAARTDDRESGSIPA
jgi:hypothetical protein